MDLPTMQQSKPDYILSNGAILLAATPWVVDGDSRSRVVLCVYMGQFVTWAEFNHRDSELKGWMPDNGTNFGHYFPLAAHEGLEGAAKAARADFDERVKRGY